MRDLIFISHANPEDNEFTRWLALRLATLGYPVWADLTQLLGGERFWDDIEEVIREGAIKFLYVLSRTSNNKPGPKDELHVAKSVQKKIQKEYGVKDFIIPVKIDDLPYDEINIQINPLNVINFTNNWAIGLEQLIKKLDRDKIQKKTDFDAEAVNKWWSNIYKPGIKIECTEEEYLSNEFEILKLPEKIYFHNIGDRKIHHILNKDKFPYPFSQHKQHIVTFAGAELIHDHAKISTLIDKTEALNVEDLLNGKYEKLINKYAFNNAIIGFVSMALERYSQSLGLKIYYLSGNQPCPYFHINLNQRVDFTDLFDKPTYRFMYGRSKENYWHFGCIFKPMMFPFKKVNILPAVLFSDDGETIWDSKEKLKKSRRTHCKNWYNKEWGDRIKAMMYWLSSGKETIEVPLSPKHFLILSKDPQEFISPVKYTEPERK